MDNNFFQQVYEIVKLIPPGRVTSYGAIARSLGATRSARMVGWALNNSIKIDNVPAHRVVNTKGILSGKLHFEYPEQMEERLLAEGIRVKNDQIIDFEKIFWDPGEELLPK